MLASKMSQMLRHYSDFCKIFCTIALLKIFWIYIFLMPFIQWYLEHISSFMFFAKNHSNLKSIKCFNTQSRNVNQCPVEQSINFLMYFIVIKQKNNVGG